MASERFGMKMQTPKTYPLWQPLCKVREQGHSVFPPAAPLGIDPFWASPFWTLLKKN